MAETQKPVKKATKNIAEVKEEKPIKKMVAGTARSMGVEVET